MNTPTKCFFTFGFIGFIYSLFRIDSIMLFGAAIVYPRILDVFFIAIGGYVFGYIEELKQNNSESEDDTVFDSFIFGVVIVIAFIVNLGLYTLIPTIIYVYVVCGLIFAFGVLVVYIGFNSKLDQTEILYLFMFGSLIALGFGLVIGGGFLALLYVTPPIIVLGTKQLFSRK